MTRHLIDTVSMQSDVSNKLLTWKNRGPWKVKKKKGTSQEVSAIILFLIFDLNQILCDPFSSSSFECVVCCFGRGASSRWLARFPCRDSSNTATTNDRPWSHTIFAPSSSKEKEEGEKQQQGKWSPCVWVGTRRTRATRFPSLNYYFFDRIRNTKKGRTDMSVTNSLGRCGDGGRANEYKTKVEF